MEPGDEAPRDGGAAAGGATIVVDVDGRSVECRAGRPLLHELLAAGLVVPTSCGGKGICHLCRVTLLARGEAEPASDLERRALGNVLVAQGMRLSCQVPVVPGLRVRLPAVETPEARRERVRRARARREGSER